MVNASMYNNRHPRVLPENSLKSAWAPGLSSFILLLDSSSTLLPLPLLDYPPVRAADRDTDIFWRWSPNEFFPPFASHCT
jgi:hypothetical protein